MVQFGIDQLLKQMPLWKNHRIGFVTNQAATTNDLIPSRKALIDHGFNITTLFSPEHGLMVDGADGKPMPDSIDQLTGLKIISLYGKKLAPTASDLSEVDILLFDIPDIGCRYYTYLWTLTYLMESCAFHQIPLVVLDRPNPISGNMLLAEGPMLESTEASFIGRWNIPVRHSCTLGELSKYFNAVRSIGCVLEIITCKEWNRSDFQPHWGIPFVATSPAIQNFESMLLYPGLCLLEATNISEGRGTHLAFQVAGAPWIESKTATALLNQMSLDEIVAIPKTFEPFEGKYMDQLCNGMQFNIQQRDFFQSVSYGLLLVRMLKELYPKDFKWNSYPTSVNKDGLHHLSKLLGITDAEKIFELPLQKFIAQSAKITSINHWKDAVMPYLLY
jgi:uncharacterized protein YbbC (DUF1343 family)